MLKGFNVERQVVPNLFAHFFSYSTEDDWESRLSQYVFHEIVAKIDYPIILTDFEMTPLYWKNVGVDEGYLFNEIPQDKRKVILRQLDKMERKKTVIPLHFRSGDECIINYAFYSESSAMKHLKMIPYLGVAFVLLFAILGVYATHSIKRNEKNVIWVGMAKEMAHQLGTPISSLLGWINLLLSKTSAAPDSDGFEKIVRYMETDVELLSKVANRFGKIGSEIELKPTNLDNLIQESVEYYKQRLPHITNKIDIIYISKIQKKLIYIEPDLIKWAIDNLLKNAIDAMQMRGGSIIVIAVQEKNHTNILVKDEGKGIPKTQFNKIFEPGISSKERGWGLGLSLSKRIIEEFHKGKIHVVHSIINEGTTFEISLPEIQK